MSQISSTATKNQKYEVFSWFYSLWKFSRPHTIIGTSLSVICLYLIANGNLENCLKLSHLWQLLGVWIACLFGNVYIVGLNQLEDVAIDRINKPHLPIAAGEFSHRQGQWIVGINGVLAMVVAAFFGSWLLTTVATSLAIGTAYSLKPIRLKRFPFLAALCIFSVRGIIVNLGLFLQFNNRLNNQNEIPLSIWVLTLFILIFTVAIAIFKDVPDMEGDKQYNISTFTLLLGKEKILVLSLWIVSSCYLGTILAGILQLPGTNSVFLVISHTGLLILLWWRSRQVDLENKIAIAQFYQFIWKLFFLEYLFFPASCLLP
jgi:homogentisate phytyltransferase / homogentisate geranylgeranyltransferase